jgi:hypothetical protein
LQSRRRATRVSEVMSQRALVRTPFSTIFCARRLALGSNCAVSMTTALGDSRIWRCRARGDFGQRETLMLNLIEPAFVWRSGSGAPCRLVMDQPQRASAGGAPWAKPDRQGIARRMRVSVPTVRTYLRRIFDKLGIERRSALAQALPMEPH